MHHFVDVLTSNFVPLTDNDPTTVLRAVEALQALLPSDGYAVGHWSIADAIAAPFLARAIPSLKNDLDSYRESDKYARFKKYYVDLTSRESFRVTFHEVGHSFQNWEVR
jgi:glutathione S-transferase